MKEKGREEEEKKKRRRRGRREERYGFMTLSKETLSMEVFIWILVVTFLGFS